MTARPLDRGAGRTGRTGVAKALRGVELRRTGRSVTPHLEHRGAGLATRRRATRRIRTVIDSHPDPTKGFNVDLINNPPNEKDFTSGGLLISLH